MFFSRNHHQYTKKEAKLFCSASLDMIQSACDSLVSHATGSTQRCYYRGSDAGNHLYDELQGFSLTHNSPPFLVAVRFVLSGIAATGIAALVGAATTGVAATVVFLVLVLGILHIAAVATGYSFNLLAGAVEAGNLHSRLRELPPPGSKG